MQKSLLTMALALALPTAYAQSSVTLYGIVDVGIENLDVGSIDATRLQSGISAGSRWGIRGSEDLGKGYRAVFTLESRFEVDTGSVTNNGALYWCRANECTGNCTCRVPRGRFRHHPAGRASASRPRSRRSSVVRTRSTIRCCRRSPPSMRSARYSTGKRGVDW